MYEQLILFEALSATQNTSADAVHKIDTSNAKINLEYCVARSFSKRQTDISGAETQEETGPDTGPAGGMVQISMVVDRSDGVQSDVLTTLLRWYRTINTTATLRGGFLGLSNTDTPALNLNPTGQLGYKLISFSQTSLGDNKGRQIFLIELQIEGDLNNLPIFQEDT